MSCIRKESCVATLSSIRIESLSTLGLWQASLCQQQGSSLHRIEAAIVDFSLVLVLRIDLTSQIRLRVGIWDEILGKSWKLMWDSGYTVQYTQVYTWGTCLEQKMVGKPQRSQISIVRSPFTGWKVPRIQQQKWRIHQPEHKTYSTHEFPIWKIQSFDCLSVTACNLKGIWYASCVKSFSTSSRGSCCDLLRGKGRTTKILKRVGWTLTSKCQFVDELWDLSKTLGILQLCQNKQFKLAFSGPKVSSRQDEPFTMRALRQIYKFRTSAHSTTPTYHDDLVCISSTTFSFKLLALKANHPSRPG